MDSDVVRNDRAFEDVSMDICWFCRVAPSQTPLDVDLYHIVERTNKFVGYGIRSETAYRTRRVSVPRCAACNQVHARMGNVSSVLVGLVVLGALMTLGFWIYSAWGTGEADAGGIVGVVVGGGFVTFMGVLLVVWLLSGVEAVADAAGANTARRGRRFPAIQSLLDEKWELGSKPPYKGDDVARSE